jgi:hypothetical protein
VSACLLAEVKPTLVPSEDWVSGGGGSDHDELAVTTEITPTNAITAGAAGAVAASTRSVLVLLTRLPRQLQAQACADLAKDSPEVLVGKRVEILDPRTATGNSQHSAHPFGRSVPAHLQRFQRHSGGSLGAGHYQVISYMPERKQHLIAKVESGRQGTGGMCVGAKVRIRTGAERISDTAQGPMRRGNVGTIVDVSSESMRVRYRDDSWHYQKRAMELVPMASTKTGDSKPAGDVGLLALSSWCRNYTDFCTLTSATLPHYVYRYGLQPG